MSIKTPNQTHFTSQVKSLIDKIYGKSIVQDSMLERAISYYAEQSTIQKKLNSFEQDFKQGEASSPSKEYKAFTQQLRLDRVDRHSHLLSICLEIIQLSEAENIDECHRKSAQLLGTIQLVNPTEGKKRAEKNEQSKALYKAVLCLRLLDRLCLDNKITDPYIGQFLQNIPSGQYAQFVTLDPEGYETFTQQVKVPLVMAALLQDIGNYHPDAQHLLLGDKAELNPFRMLEMDQRKQLLQINYRETVKYLVDGIGKTGYAGNSKEERDKFNRSENEKIVFIRHLLKSSINPKKGIGNLIKVPQIYTSIILSTKESYNYKLLPKVYQALNQNAERGICSKTAVDALYQITGMFPQGFGITYIPIDKYGEQQERYEYAIVNQLYPPKPEQALCRMATRYLAFIGFGQNVLINDETNLYFPETAKKLSSISKERLNEILEKLSSNYQERQKLDLLPRCWHSSEYFSAKDNQKLWNKPG